MKIGYLQFEVGHLQFAKRNPNVLLAKILIPLSVSLCAIGFVVFIACLRHLRRGPWKKLAGGAGERGRDTVRYTAPGYGPYGDGVELNGNGPIYRGNHVENRERCCRFLHALGLFRSANWNLKSLCLNFCVAFLSRVFAAYQRLPANQGARQRHPAAAAHNNSTLMDDESRRLIEDANLLISRDSLILSEVIGQGQSTATATLQKILTL